jgi:hypothetical protein
LKSLNITSLILLLEHLLALLHDGHLDTISTGERDHGLGTLTDGEHVGHTGAESLSLAILQVYNVEATRVLLLVDHNTDTADVSTTGDDAGISDIELDEFNDLSSLEVKLDSVVDLDEGIGIGNSSTIVANDVRNSLGLTVVEAVDTSGGLVTLGDLGNSAELVLSLIGVDLVKNEATLDVKEKSEALVGLVNGDNIHETNGEVDVSSDLVVDLDVASHDNHQNLASGKSVFQAVSQDQTERKALSQLVRTGRRTRSPSSSELVKHPVLGSI